MRVDGVIAVGVRFGEGVHHDKARMLIGSLRTTSVMAMVVDARAFGSHPKRSTIREHPMTVADYFALGLLVALTMTVVILVVLHIGNRQL